MKCKKLLVSKSLPVKLQDFVMCCILVRKRNCYVFSRGIGYRWEFKKNVNVRLDYGFGKNGQSGFIFNINEAF